MTPSARPGPRRLLLLVSALLLVASSPALAGIFGKRRDPPPDAGSAPVVDTDPPPREAPPPPPSTALWPGRLPLVAGPLPEGLANASAQGCAACHGEQHAAWSASAHAAGPTPALREAAAAAGQGACLSCHLPLDVQHRQLVVSDAGRPKAFDNPGFDATLAMEGVTCAACHVRGGQVLGATPPDNPSPHAAGWSQELTGAEACAPCHQLSWPGADRPLYDTIGEWERSAYAAADIGCATCHLGEGAGHGMAVPSARAVSLLVELPPAALVRGGEAIEGSVILQNTGAGHAFPTGSPWRGVRLEARIEGPAARGEGRADWGEGLTAELLRTLSDAPPWTTTSDTRLPAGGQLRWPLSLSLPVDAPRGDYTLRLTLTRTRVSEDGVDAIGEPLLERRLPLTVQ